MRYADHGASRVPPSRTRNRLQLSIRLIGAARTPIGLEGLSTEKLAMISADLATRSRQIQIEYW